MEGNVTSKHSDASKHGKEGNASKHGKEGNAMTFQYFSENLVYYAPTMLILNPKLQCFSVFLQYFASKISTSILKNQYR